MTIGFFITYYHSTGISEIKHLDISNSGVDIVISFELYIFPLSIDKVVNLHPFLDISTCKRIKILHGFNTTNQCSLTVVVLLLINQLQFIVKFVQINSFSYNNHKLHLLISFLKHCEIAYYLILDLL